MDSPRQPRFGELSALSNSLSRIVPGAKLIDMLVDEPGVQACRFTAAQDSGVLKRWPAHRVAKAGPQVGAEVRAAAVFGAVLDEPSPLMALMLQQSADPRGSNFSVYPYAGPSAEHMLDTHWVHLTQQQREALCKKLAISGLKVIQMLENVPEEFGGPKLHRDGKLANWCYNQEGDFFVCIDFGGMCSTSLDDWYGIVDPRYIDSYFGLVVDGAGASTSQVVRVLQSVDDWRLHTTRSLDLYLLALAVIELYLGRLPAAIDYHQYGPERVEEYLAVVCDYQWPDCVELADAPGEMMDFLLWCTEPGPDNRPATAAEALQHEWLADQVAAVEEAVAEAAPAWVATNNRLREALAGWHASPAQAAAPADSSNASSSSCSRSEASHGTSADCAADGPEQLLLRHTSSGGSSTIACTTPLAASSSAGDAAPSPVSTASEALLPLDDHVSTSSPKCCGKAACQQQDPTAPAVGSKADSSGSKASSPAGCTADSSEQLRLAHTGSSGNSSTMACTTPLATSDPAGDAAASPASSTSKALLLLHDDSSTSNPELCVNAACQQQDSAAPADSSNARSSSNSEAAGPADCTGDRSEQLWPGHSSSRGGTSSMGITPSATSDPAGDAAPSPVSSASESWFLLGGDGSISSPECCSNAACQQQDRAAPADSSTASSCSSSEASSCSPDCCTSVSSSGQLWPGHSSGGGGSSTVCTTPSPTAERSGHQASAGSNVSQASLLLDGDSSTIGSSPTTSACCITAACQQLDPAAPVDCSDASPGGSAVISPEQLSLGHSSSGGGSMTFTNPLTASDPAGAAAATPISGSSQALLLLDGNRSTSSSECCSIAACQQQDAAAPINCSNANTSNDAADSCTTAGCSAAISSEQRRLGFSSDGSIMVCTTPLVASDTGGEHPAQQQWPPSSDSSSLTYSTAFQASGAVQHQTASSSQASSSSGTCNTPSTALLAVPHMTATSAGTSSNGGCGEQLPYCRCCCSRQRLLVSHPLQRRHSHHPCKWVLRHVVRSVRCVGSQLRRLVKVPARQQ